METTPPKPRAAWNPWPVSIIAFFAMAIIGCGSFIAFCSRHPADLVAADYYEQEVRYQGQIDRLQHAEQPSQLATVGYDPLTRKITVSLPPGTSQANATGTIQLYRPSAVDLDKRLSLETDSKGAQTIDAANLQPGLWKVRVSWTVGQREYYLDQKVIIGAKAS